MWIFNGWDVYPGGLSRKPGVWSTDWKNGPDHLNSPFDILMSLKSFLTYRKIPGEAGKEPRVLPASR